MSTSLGIKNLLLEIHYRTNSFSDVFGLVLIILVAIAFITVFSMVNI